MNFHVFHKFLKVLGGSKATRSMGESTAADRESMGPNRGMATPSSPNLLFPGPAVPAAQNKPGSWETGREAWKPAGKLGIQP